MEERSFLERLESAPCDAALLREYADWLNAQGDLRGEHLAAELDVREADAHLRQLQTQLSKIRAMRSCDFAWLDSVLPLNVESPVDGIFYDSPAPDRDPFVQVGDLCFPNTKIGFVEQQKVFHSICADCSGVVSEICVSHGATVSVGDIVVKLVRPRRAVPSDH